MSSFQHRAAIVALGVSLLIGRSLNADVNLFFAEDGDRLVVADIAVKGFEFSVVAVYAPISPFLDDPKRIISVDDWNAILDPEIDRVWRGE